MPERNGRRRITTRGCLLICLIGGLLAGACARRVPAPVVTAPRYPDFLFPDVPAELRQADLIRRHQTGWQWLQAGDFGQAEREFLGALKRSAAFYPSEAALGYVELAQRDFRDALRRFEGALQRRETYVPALVGRGEALLGLTRDGEALVSFETALGLDNTLADVRRRVEVLRFRGTQGTILDARRAAEGGRFDEAVRLYQQAIASSPESAFLYRDLADVQRRQGRPEVALDSYRQAADLDPADAASRVRIGEILEERGDSEGAETAYSAALALEANDAVLARLEALRARARLARLPAEYRAIGDAASLSRGELAALIGIHLEPVLQSALAVGLVTTDTRNHWAAPWIIAVVSARVMDPYPNHTFQPTGAVRRSDLAQAVSRLLKIMAARQPALQRQWQQGTPKIADVGTGNLNYADVSLAVASGVMPLLDGGTFRLTRPVSGAEAIEVIERLERLFGLSR